MEQKERQRVEPKVRSKKQIAVIMIAAMLLFAGSFAVVIFCDYLEKRGSGSIPWLWIGIIGFLACNIVSIGLMFSIYKDAVYHDMKDKDAKYGEVPLTSIRNMSKQHIHQILMDRRFKEVEKGYFRKKIFSFAKDSICYYVKFAEIAFVSEDLSEMVNRELACFAQTADENKCACLLLLLYQDQVSERDLEEIKELSKYLVVCESAMPARIYQTCVPVLIDTMTDTGCFLDARSRMSITVYAHGCRLLKKYLKKPVQK